MVRLIWLALLLLFAAPTGGVGQGIRVEGSLDHPAARLLRDILGRDQYTLLRRDTVLPADFRAAGDLIVLGADVRLEGRVEGSVAVIDGALFLRPGSHVGGRLVVVRGDVLRSAHATTGEILELPAAPRAEVEQLDGEYTIVLRPPPGPPPVRLTGLFGLGLPTYDRVDGLTLRWGSSARLSGDSIGPVARAELTYRFARGDPGGAVALELPVGGQTWIAARARRATATNETWIRGDLVNTAAALTLRSDVRDYYLTDELTLALERRPRRALIAGEARLVPRLGVRASRDRSVAASDPWSLFGDEPWRHNPAISDGTLASLVGGTVVEWRGRTVTLAGDLGVEWAPPGVGDFEFVQMTATTRWSVQALWRHTIDFFVHTRQTLGTQPAPRQRWSFVGGSGTLSTLETGSLRGDRLVFVESAYRIPLRGPALPVLGPPALVLEHAVGSSWVTGSDAPRWEQNLGAGVDFGLVRAVLAVNPADGLSRPKLNLSAGLPF